MIYIYPKTYITTIFGYDVRLPSCHCFHGCHGHLSRTSLLDAPMHGQVVLVFSIVIFYKKFCVKNMRIMAYLNT